jgi:Flp pilus assembly protein TadG
MRTRRGTTALEFALVFPLAMLLLAGIVDWAWFMFQELTMVVATGRGSRIAGGLPDESDPTGTAETSTRTWMSAYGLDGDAATVDASIDSASDPQVVTVTASLDFTPLIGMVPTPDEVQASSSGVYYGDYY